MKPDFLEKASRNFEDKYGVKLGKSGALFLSLIVQNGKENNEMIKKATDKIKESVVSQSIYFADKKQAFYFGLGLALPIGIALLLFLLFINLY
ncbi:MAG: hypothetical protein ACOVO2_02535 [Emticicia sp.]|uniref:hypothetical protein n=1 Tax=Emticicia sp. TaxID=1930953 RepID=UPI003BA6284D